MYWCIILTVVVKQISGFKERWMDYGGESFPTKYLMSDGYVPSHADLDYYMKQLLRPLTYFNEAPNGTDISCALGAYYTKSVLKRAFRDYGSKLQNNVTESLKKLIHLSENIVSHYTYKNAPYGWDDLEYRASKIFYSDESQIHAIRHFNRGRLRRWILTRDNNMNKHQEAMDKATMPKEAYGYLTDRNPGNKYFIGMYASDHCVAKVAYHGEPVDVTKLRKCELDEYCERHIYSNPSIGYFLSHRFVNLYLLVSKECYIKSDIEDSEMLDRMCGNMYREAVYLARRGYFHRDLFLELIALCGMMGYEEFHRRNWYYKAASWINQYGCVVENRNHVKNRTRNLNSVTDIRRRSSLKEFFCQQLMSECDEHPTALLLVVLAQAVRHAAGFVTGNL